MTSFPQWLTAENIKQTEIAERIGASQSLISMIVTGQRRPSVELAKKIEKITQGAVTLYDLYGEREAQHE